jgi:hypothetical protein
MTVATAAMQRLSQHWQILLPETFHRLYNAFEYPFISPCEFLSLDQMISDEERWRGMLPQFLPFGHNGEEDYFGFYVGSDVSAGDYPVLAWNHEYDNYYPVASGFGAFLRVMAVYGRYLAEDAFEEQQPEEETSRRKFAEVVGIPPRFLTDPLPRNEQELYEKLLKADPQSPWALCELGSRFLAAGDLQRSRDCLVRASETAPWFSDPYYLLAESYHAEGGLPRACELYWHVFQSPIALSTRTSNYVLSEDHAEAEIYEAATERCAACKDHLDESLRDSALWEFLQKGDPFSSGPRLELAKSLAAKGDHAASERELLNALTLATDEVEMDEAYSRLVAFYEAAGRDRDAALCRRDMEL